jgi:acyl-CoA thioester hydrolase
VPSAASACLRDAMTTTTPAPFSRFTAAVLPEWIDLNGHMNVGYYHVVFDQAADPFFEWLGLTPEFRRANHSSTFALESHLHFVREVHVGDPLRFESRLLAFDHKRIHYYQEMFHGRDGHLCATYESISSHVDFRSRRTAPMPAELSARLARVMEEHGRLERPWQVGHVISTRPAKP